MKTQLITIQYSHCIKWTIGQLDAVPWSAYETRSRDLRLVVLEFAEDDFEYHVIDSNDRILGEGDTDDQAICHAQYFLMRQSREEAHRQAIVAPTNAIINPAWIEAGKGPHIDIP